MVPLGVIHRVDMVIFHGYVKLPEDIHVMMQETAISTIIHDDIQWK